MVGQSFDERFKGKLLETLRFSIDFIESHGLRWWACGGTMLGAVRHNNIIPWDDDVDIMMPREDYKKLLSFSSDLNNTKYVLLSPHSKDYYLTSAKICDWETTVVESARYPFPLGVFVDIFPLDRFDYPFQDYQKRFESYQRKAQAFKLGMSRYSISEAIDNIRTRHFGSLYFGCKSVLYPYKKREKYRKRFLDVEEVFNKGEGAYIASPTGAYGVREFFLSEWFEETIEVQFDDFHVKVPKEYDKYLSVMYGDYLQLPPMEKRMSHHGQFYINVDKHCPWDEVILDKHLLNTNQV